MWFFAAFTLQICHGLIWSARVTTSNRVATYLLCAETNTWIQTRGLTSHLSNIPRFVVSRTEQHQKQYVRDSSTTMFSAAAMRATNASGYVSVSMGILVPQCMFPFPSSLASRLRLWVTFMRAEMSARLYICAYMSDCPQYAVSMDGSVFESLFAMRFFWVLIGLAKHTLQIQHVLNCVRTMRLKPPNTHIL